MLERDVVVLKRTLAERDAALRKRAAPDAARGPEATGFDAATRKLGNALRAVTASRDEVAELLERKELQCRILDAFAVATGAAAATRAAVAACDRDADLANRLATTCETRGEALEAYVRRSQKLSLKPPISLRLALFGLIL